ncbi:MAG: hypothetical protein HQ542_01490, partial [Bacteroidia bacterium]|nr:hypothetical protein [Bacteroidia bacterium]
MKYDQNLTIANALLEKFEVCCQTNGARFVSVRISAQSLAEIHSLERSGFRYIESWIYNKCDLSRVGDFGETRCELRLGMPDDCNIMLDYSKGAFVTQRFHADPSIVREKADSFYEKWILSAFGDSNQRVLVLDIDNRPVAFMIYYKKDLRQYFGLQFAMWKMALIDPANRCKGLGTDFFIALLHYHHEEGLDVVDSGLSVRNVNSLNLH